MPLDPNQVFLAVIRIVLAVIVVVLVFTTFFQFRIVVETDEMQRTAVQMSELYMLSEFTDEHAIFIEDKLKAIDNTMLEPLKHCNFGSHLIFKRLDTDDTWDFGFTREDELRLNDRDISYASVSFDAAIKDGINIIPTRMTVELFDTMLTRGTCLADQAFMLREVRDFRIPRCVERTGGVVDLGLGAAQADTVCEFSLEKRGDEICFIDSLHRPQRRIVNCRHVENLGYEFIDFKNIYQKDKELPTIRAYPLKSQPVIAKERWCEILEDPDNPFLATKNDIVQAVYMCVV